MLVASIPAKFSIPWANSAGGSYINAIPTNSQIGIIAGAASLTDGFPPTTMQAGGTPPAGPDFNGILKWVTQWAQWQAAGAPVAYDSTFQTAVSGYPLGAVVASATTFGVSWMSTVDANATNPDMGGAGWVKIKGQGPYYAADTGTANALAIWVPAIYALAPGQLFIIKKYSAANTGAVTLNVNAIGAVSVVWPDGTVLIAGDWPANVTGLIEYDGVNMNVLSVMGPSVFARKSSAAATNIVPFSATTTWTVPAGVTVLKRARVWGGGGAGGSSTGNPSAASGAGGGGYAESVNIAVTPGATITITVGAGGAASGGAGNGGAGGQSSMGSAVIASGGGGGYGTAGTFQPTPGAAGSGTTGMFLVSSQGGGSGSQVGSGTSSGWSGAGGGSAFGAPGVAGVASAGGGAGVGSFPGGGGVGGSNGNGGAVGAAGFVVIEY